MADTVAIAKRGSAVWRKIFHSIKHNTIGHAKRRLWIAASADPYVDAGSQDTYPVKVGDLAWQPPQEEEVAELGRDEPGQFIIVQIQPL